MCESKHGSMGKNSRIRVGEAVLGERMQLAGGLRRAATL